jgi:hypothetical protein
MPLPSFYHSSQSGRAWSIARAAAWGALIGAVAAALKTLAPWPHAADLGSGAAARLIQSFPEVAGATLAFALLCAAAAAARNFALRYLIRPPE